MFITVSSAFHVFFHGDWPFIELLGTTTIDIALSIALPIIIALSTFL